MACFDPERSTGKGGLGPWYLPGFTREQNRTFWG